MTPIRATNTPSTTTAIHGQNNATKLDNTTQATSEVHGILWWWRLQHGITRGAQLCPVVVLFPNAWMENGALWTPVSLKEARQGDSKMIKNWKHAMADVLHAWN
jgi:hypothetical protein